MGGLRIRPLDTIAGRVACSEWLSAWRSRFRVAIPPVLRLSASTRRFMGLSVTAYTVVSVSAAIGLGVVLALIAVTIPLE